MPKKKCSKPKKKCLYSVVGFGLREPRTFTSPASAQNLAATQRKKHPGKKGKIQRACFAKSSRLKRGAARAKPKKYVPTYSLVTRNTPLKVFRGADALERAMTFAKAAAKREKQTIYIDQGARLGHTSYFCHSTGKCGHYSD